MQALKYILPIYGLLFIFWGFRNPKGFLLFTGIMTMPFRTTYTLVDVGPYTGWTNGINISISDISFIALFFYLLLTRREMRRPSNHLALSLALLIGACALSLINSSWKRVSLYEMALIVQAAFLYYFVFTYAIENEKDLRMVVLFLLLSLLFQSSFAITQYATGLELDIFRTGTPEVSEEEGGLIRAVGTTGRPNTLAVYLVPLLFLTLSIRFLSPLYRRLSLVAIATGSVALLLSGSRGGWVAFLFSLAIFFVFLWRRRLIGMRSISVLFLCGVSLVLFFLPYVSERIGAETSTNAALSRIPLLKIAWEMIVDHPVVGVGANTFITSVSAYTRTFEFRYIWTGLVHNQYLLVFAETGLLGLMAFLWLFYSLFRESVVCGRLGNPFARIIGLSTLLAFVSMAVHMLFDIYSSALALAMMFVLCGLCSAARKIADDSLRDGIPVRTPMSRLSSP